MNMFSQLRNRFKSTLINNNMLQYSIKEIISKLELDIKNIINKQEINTKKMNKSINKIIITGFISLGSGLAFIKYDNDNFKKDIKESIKEMKEDNNKRFDKLESMIKK
jgi:tetrahydrodipicolinate N-succinyltransferase